MCTVHIHVPVGMGAMVRVMVRAMVRSCVRAVNVRACGNASVRACMHACMRESTIDASQSTPERRQLFGPSRLVLGRDWCVNVFFFAVFGQPCLVRVLRRHSDCLRAGKGRDVVLDGKEGHVTTSG